MLLAAVALATHAHVLWGGWVRDDFALIVNNPAVRGLANMPAQLTEPFLGIFWRPSVTISYSIEYALWGLHPAGFHATNLALHCAATLLVFALWRRLSDHPHLPLLAGAFFAVHGAHYQPAVIADRTGLLATTFSLLAWWCVTRAGAGPQRRRAMVAAWHAAALLAYAVALGAKEEAVVLPLVMVTVGVLQPWPVDGPAHWRRMWPAAGGMLGLGLIYLQLRGRILGGPGLLTDALPGLGVRVLSLPTWLLHHWRDVAVPLWLDMDYRGLVWPHAGTGVVVLSVAAVAACGLAVWRARGERPELVLAVVWGVLAWLPTSNLVPIYPETATTHVFMPPHFLYFPNAAWVGVLASLGVWAVDRRPVAGGVAIAAVLALHAVTTVRMNAVWMSDVRLYRYVLAAHPRHPVMWRNLGLALTHRGEWADAAAAYEQSLAVQPSPEAHLGLALVHQEQGRPADANRELKACIALEPRSTACYVALAELPRGADRPAAARAILTRGLRAGGDRVQLWTALARVERDAGQLAPAAQLAQDALELAPDAAETWYMLGTIRAEQGDAAGARDAWEQAETLAPGMTPAREYLRRGPP